MNNDITTLANQVKMALAHFACPPSVEVKNGEILIDGGSISICLDDYEIAIDITGFTDVDEENVKGHGTYVIGDSFGKADDESYRIDWIANFEKVVVENGKVYQVYSIRGNN